MVLIYMLSNSGLIFPRSLAHYIFAHILTHHAKLGRIMEILSICLPMYPFHSIILMKMFRERTRLSHMTYDRRFYLIH